MKKILSFLIITFSLFTVSGCGGINKTDFEKYINKLPNILTNDYTLPTTYQFQEIIWEVNDELLEDNKIEYFYSDEDVEIELKAILGKEKVTKKIIIKKTNFVTDIKINTTNNTDITSKDDYLRGDLKITNAGYFDTEIETLRIRGRGNSTWGYEKKPFRIKFDENTSLLGMKPATDYVLLAEHNDKSLMRNYIAHYISRFLNLPHSLETRYVNLTLNGDFKGLYLLTEQVAVAENRLNIDDSKDVDGGFLIELERDFERAKAEGKEDLDWFRLENPNPNDRDRGGNVNAYLELYYVIKSPKLKNLDKKLQQDKVNYYKKTFTDFEQSVLKSEYEQFIDVGNFIDFFIIAELMKQVDIGYSSVYIVKDKNKKLQMGPIWDFDISSGNGNYYAYGPKGFWTDYNPWFGILINNSKFEKQYIKRFDEINELFFNKIIEEIERASKLISKAADKNFQRWDMHMNDGFNPNPIEMLKLNNHKQQVDYFKNYLIERNNWILTTLNKEGYIGYLGENDQGWV